MTPEQAAEKLHGNQYGSEGSNKLFAEMKAAGLVAVFGASDDLMEFRGAIYDEIGCYEGGTAKLNQDGLIVNRCDEGDQCPNYKEPPHHKIKAVWCPKKPECSWIYKTDIPHATFDILEDGELYCRGIVFRLADAARN